MEYTEHLEQVEQALKDREAVIRETAIWSLSKLQPTDLASRISGFIGDANQQVADVARQIYSSLPDPDPAT